MEDIRLGALRQISLRVGDVARAVAFYRDVLGLRLVADLGALAFLDLGGTRLLLERGVRFEDEPHVVVTDHDGTFGPPGEAEWMTFFRDSEGNLLALSAREPAG